SLAALPWWLRRNSDLSLYNVAIGRVRLVATARWIMDETENLSPAVTRRRLRTELRRARLDAGLTQEQTARAMDWSLSKLIRVENGTNNISTNDLKALAQYYQIADEKQVANWLALARSSRERTWWSTSDIPKPLAQLIEYENAAY